MKAWHLFVVIGLLVVIVVTINWQEIKKAGQKAVDNITGNTEKKDNASGTHSATWQAAYDAAINAGYNVAEAEYLANHPDKEKV